MDYLSLLKVAKRDAERLVTTYPIPKEVRQSDTYEALPQFLLAHCLVQRLKGDYTRVRIEFPFKRGGRVKHRVDVVAGNDFNHAPLLVEVKPVWDWDKSARGWMERDVLADANKLAELRDSRSYWEGSKLNKCAVVVALFKKPSPDPKRSKEFESLRDYCKNRSVELLFLRMYP